MSSSRSLTRRRALGLLSSAGLAGVAGFDPLGRRWIARAEAASCPSFVDTPYGELLLDAPTRGANGRDKGNIVFQTPCAVLRPGSVNDIERMIHYCRRYDIKVATRGQGHTMFGQEPLGRARDRERGARHHPFDRAWRAGRQSCDPPLPRRRTTRKR
jgi:cytokinin dehydrogenase